MGKDASKLSTLRLIRYLLSYSTRNAVVSRHEIWHCMQNFDDKALLRKRRRFCSSGKIRRLEVGHFSSAWTCLGRKVRLLPIFLATKVSAVLRPSYGVEKLGPNQAASNFGLSPFFSIHGQGETRGN